MHACIVCNFVYILSNGKHLGDFRDTYVSLRISGGNSTGRLEIQDKYGVWGTVCHDGFHEKAAIVACKQLRYDTGEVLLDERYMHGSFVDCYSTIKDDTYMAPHW